MAIKQFFKSIEMFCRWRDSQYSNSSCHYQTYDPKQEILIEKGHSTDREGNLFVYLVEYLSEGNGFLIYDLRRMNNE